MTICSTRPALIVGPSSGYDTCWIFSTGASGLLALLERLIPDAADRRKVPWDTPYRLFGFE